MLTWAFKEEVIQTGTPTSKVKQYVLATPISTTADGSYISNVVSVTRLRRSRRDLSSSPQQLYFNVTAFGRDFHLRLRPNTRLIAPGAVVEWHEDSVESGNGIDSVKPGQTGGVADRIWKTEPLWTGCAYVGDLVDIPGASVAISNCDGLAGIIRTEEDDYFIEPLEKGKQLEEEGGRAHVVYRRSAIAQNPTDVLPDFHREGFPNKGPMDAEVATDSFPCAH
ncbi:A disintegrin and metalloproteinase with thrombospondin motifs 3-like [Sphaerodactylus townsendi]|uniref:A disintegrin and metalloproteinase with thrombospondin motifs 3-like n=1 Tax=Sphaerodactylus townsendi TaxID=933632 RepID=UPI0020275BA7|nr:A disintegrin and metalloproteinase with thrombospondin motifs 3-like [Sphaerodactylus townsendi]